MFAGGGGWDGRTRPVPVTQSGTTRFMSYVDVEPLNKGRTRYIVRPIDMVWCSSGSVEPYTDHGSIEHYRLRCVS